MEKMKDPAMLLSIANTAAIVGTAVYFYKQVEAVRLDMVKVSQTLNGVLKKISEIEKGDQNSNDALHTLNEQIKHINDQIGDLPSLDDIANFDMDIDEIVDILEQNNIPIKRPSQSVRIRRSGDRRGPPIRRGGYEPEIDETPRRNTPRTTDRTPRAESSRDYESRPRDIKPRDMRQSQSNYEDDSDLIGEIKRQTTR